METPSVDRESHAPDNTYAPTSVIAEHYRVERELGRGGMATVYLCSDLRDQKQVAIKVLRHELGSAVIIERFLREIAFASELDHPQIPKVLGSGVIDDVPYYVMTYIEGESLKKRLEREKQLPIADALKIACAVIEPTAYAHKRGIVHRDLKPDNILLSKDAVFVLDFGIARAIIESGGDRLTSTGIGVGTPAYMSPEQALGDRNLDVRSDIYSIGCVVYEMIAGIPPFVGPTAQVIISRRFAAPPPPIRELREGVSDDLEYAIDRALAKSPADRWPTVDEFGSALNACATGEHRFSSSGSHTGWWKRPHRRSAAATLGMGLVAASALAMSAAYRDPLASAQRAVKAWDLEGAELDLRRAVSARPGSSVAQMWLAQVMMLQGGPSVQWKANAVSAGDHRSELGPEDRARTEALVALASGQYSEACAKFGGVARAARTRDPSEFTSTLAYADCLRDDQTILSDARSPSGYRFASSYQLIDSLYEGVLERHRKSPAAYALIMPRLESVLLIQKGRLRLGTLKGRNSRTFASVPSLAGDSLLYIPSPLPPSAPWHPVDEAGLPAAITRNRQRLRALAFEWTRVTPADPTAHEAFARILEATGELGGGDVSALGEIINARKLANTSTESVEDRVFRQIRLGNAQVRLYVKLNRFDSAATLADSILAGPMPTTLDAERLDTVNDLVGALAALRGRVSRVLAIEQKYAARSEVRLSSGETITLPLALGRDYVAFYSYAAFGGPADTLLAILSRLRGNVTALLPRDQTDAIRIAIFKRSLRLSASALGPRLVSEELQLDADGFVRAIGAVARGRRDIAKAVLDSIAKTRVGFAPGEITMDIVYQESWLRAAAGDSAGAARDLDNALRGLSAASPSVLGDLRVAASLVRAMALRSELAAAANQAEVAKSWARAVVQLWGTGESIVRPTVERLQVLANDH